MTNATDYAPPSGDAELNEMVRAWCSAFMCTPEIAAEAMASCGDDSHRRLVEDGRVVACASLLPTGQYLGGRRVSAIGVAAVAVPPEARGRGAAGRMMQGVVREMRESGAAIGSLYASTRSLYRQSGFEQSGHAHRAWVNLLGIDVRERGAEIRPLDFESDFDSMRTLQREWAAQRHGNFDRHSHFWRAGRRALKSGGECFGIFENGTLTGYCVLEQERPEGRRDRPGPGGTLNVIDRAWTTIHAARALWTVLASYSAQREHARMVTGVADPMLLMLGETRYELPSVDWLLTRIVDVKKAIEERGYASAISAACTVRVQDPLFAENDGVWRIAVSEGRANASRDDDAAPDATLHIRGLASIHSGFMSAEQIADAGLAEGTPDALESLSSIFASPAPWTIDMF